MDMDKRGQTTFFLGCRGTLLRFKCGLSPISLSPISHNGPGGYVVEYNVGRLIGVDKAGSPSSTLKINVRDGVIHTVFPL